MKEEEEIERERERNGLISSCTNFYTLITNCSLIRAKERETEKDREDNGSNKLDCQFASIKKYY